MIVIVVVAQGVGDRRRCLSPVLRVPDRGFGSGVQVGVGSARSRAWAAMISSAQGQWVGSLSSVCRPLRTRGGCQHVAAEVRAVTCSTRRR